MAKTVIRKKELNEIEDYPRYLIPAVADKNIDGKVHYEDISKVVNLVNNYTEKKGYYLTEEFFAGQILQQQVHGFTFRRLPLPKKTIYVGVSDQNPDKILLVENVEKYCKLQNIGDLIKKNFSDF